MPDGPFEAVPDGKLAVRRRIRDDLHGHVEVLRFPRDGVRPGGRGEVRVHVRVLGPGRHEPLLAAVGPGQVGHDGAGDPEVHVVPVEEVLVLDVAAAHQGGLSVQERELPMVPVGGQAGKVVVQEERRLMEGIHPRTHGPEPLQRRPVLVRIGRLVQDNPDIDSLGRPCGQDACEQGAAGIQPETVGLHVDGLFGLPELVLEQFPVLLSIGDEGHGIALRRPHVHVLFHQGGQLLIFGPYARVAGRIHHLGHIRRVHRRTVAAAGQEQAAAQQDQDRGRPAKHRSPTCSWPPPPPGRRDKAGCTEARC